jgi:hypothetical protein
MVGAVILSRSVPDRAVSDEILQAVAGDLLARQAGAGQRQVASLSAP